MNKPPHSEETIYSGHKRQVESFLKYSDPRFGHRPFASRVKTFITTTRSSRRPRSPQWVFVACMSKSGSTYICNKLCSITGYKSMSPRSYFMDLEQTIDIRMVKHLLDMKIVCQMHTPGKLFNIEIMKRYGIKPVILIRDPRDVILSFHDHLQNEVPLGPFGRIDPQWYELEYDNRIEYLLYHFLPSIVAWYRYWLQNKHHLEHMLVKYEDLLISEESKLQLFQNILRFNGLEELADGLGALPPDSAKELSRTNVAALSRWKSEMNKHHLNLFDKISGDTLDPHFPDQPHRCVVNR